MKRNPKAMCGACPYWDRLDASDAGYIPYDNVTKHGLCCRYAPRPVADGEGIDMAPHAIWPFTHQDYFCGEHPGFWRGAK
jgi:hypothetical protein